MRRVNLFCLPHAGGGIAVYRHWQARLPAWLHVIPLHVPGRGLRHEMRPMHRWPELLALLSQDTRPYLKQPFAIFGHSMGALVGIELAHTIRLQHRVTPIWFGASGCAAPSRQEVELKWLDCPKEELIDEVRSLNGTPQALLENTEFLDMVLPILRADFHLCGSYQYQAKPPLDCPMLVLGGTDDKISAEPLNLLAWSKETSRSCQVEMLTGDHFFIDQCRDAVIDLVVNSLDKVVS